jgi:tetratricopeptide (TPR) repeat protein
MITRARSQWVGLTVAIVVTVAGCVEKKPYEAAREAAPSGQPCDAAMNAMKTLRATAADTDAKTGPQEPGQQGSLLPVEVLRARNLLRREGSRCYEQRLTDIRAIETTDRQKAVEGYGSLNSFVGSVRAFGVEFPVIDFDTKIAEIERIDRDAEEAYAAAEAAMQARRFQEAIALYRRSLDIVANYKEARPKIAACYYEMAVGATGNQLYRQATQFFRMAEQYQPSYRDSRVRVARIQLALGNYFLAQGYPRNAMLEYEAAESVVPDFPPVRSQLEAAKAKAVERVAVVGIGNRTGATLEGMVVEKIIADSIFDKLQKKKSQFLELYPRALLEAMPPELRLALQDVPGQVTVQGSEKLRGVRYLVTGRITQVSERRGGPARARRETSVQVPVYQTVTEFDQTGRANTYQKQVGTRTQNVQYDEIGWFTEIAVAGSVDVFDVQPGKIVLSRNFDKRESGGGRWAENPNIPGAQSQLSADVQTLLHVTSPDTIASRALDSLTEELVSAILEKIDAVPSVPDPTVVLAELQESGTPTLVAAPPGGEKAAGPAPKAELAHQQQRVKVKADAVNIRLGPSTQSQALGRAKKSEVFPLVSRQKDWVKIRLRDGREGWIAERLAEMLPE